MKIDNFMESLPLLPLLLQYVVPGVWCLLLVNFIASKEISVKDKLYLPCIISYILLSLVSLIRVHFFKSLPNTAIINTDLAIVLGTIVVVFISILSQRKWVNQLSIKLFHKTLNSNIWMDAFDFDNGSNLKVYLKNKDYYIIAQLANLDVNGTDPWLILKSFVKIDVTTNENYKDEPNYIDNPDVKIAIRFSDIEHIEIF